MCMVIRLRVKTLTALTTQIMPWPKLPVLIIKMNIAQVLVIFWVIVIKIIMTTTMWCLIPHLTVVAKSAAASSNVTTESKIVIQ